MPGSRDRLRRLRVEAEVHRFPESTSASLPPTEGPGSLADRLMKLDLQLARAMAILRSQREYEAILRKAAAARAARPGPDETSNRS